MSIAQVRTISDSYLKKTNNQSVQSNKEWSAINCSIHTGKGLLLQLFWCFKIAEELPQNRGCTGQPFFASGQGGAEEKFFGLGCGGVTVKLGAYSGWGRAGRGSLENFRGRGVHPCSKWSLKAPFLPPAPCWFCFTGKRIGRESCARDKLISRRMAKKQKYLRLQDLAGREYIKWWMAAWKKAFLD